MPIFPDYNFKLVVMQQLIELGSFAEKLEELKSRPEIAKRLSGDIDYGQTIPEIDDFFRQVELTKQDLDAVTELWFDGGNDIYHLIRPFWSGTDDDFDTASVDGFEMLKNLKIVHHHAMVPDAEVDRIRAAGIDCQ